MAEVTGGEAAGRNEKAGSRQDDVRTADAPQRVRVNLRAVSRDRWATVPVSAQRITASKTVRHDGTVYLRGLASSQFWLAIGTLLGFLAVIAALTLVLVLLPYWGDPILFGVPLSWLLHAYGFYPVIVAFAVLYVYGAEANERRYAEFAAVTRESTEDS